MSAAAIVSRMLEVRGASGALPARLYRAGAAKQHGLLVFFHSGGFSGGAVDDADAFARGLVSDNDGWNVLVASYTLASASPFPAAAEDAHAVLVWAMKNKARLGWSGQRLIVAGVEAGANLAAVACLMARDRCGPAIAGQILIMPMLDAALTSLSMRAGQPDAANACAAAYRSYLPNAADRTHPYASPLHASRLHKLAPALILSLDDDPLRDEAELYGAKLIACGVKTTVTRLSAPASQPDKSRNHCAAQSQVRRDIASFIQTL